MRAQPQISSLPQIVALRAAVQCLLRLRQSGAGLPAEDISVLCHSREKRLARNLPVAAPYTCSQKVAAARHHYSHIDKEPDDLQGSLNNGNRPERHRMFQIG